MEPSESKRTKVFISYSHKDRRWMDRLQDYLKSLSHECPIEVWDDTKIAPGSKWEKEIESAVNSAKVAILLVSVDFLASDFIAKNELQPLLAAAKADAAKIIPVIVGPCRFKRTSLSQFLSFNPEDKPLSQMRKAQREKLFNELTSQIEDVMLAPDERVADPDGRKQCEDKLAAVRELLLRESLSKYELLHLKKLAGEGAYQYKLSDSFKEELRRLRDKFRFITNSGPIGQLPPAGDLKEHIELTSNGRRFIKIWEIVMRDEA